MTARTIGSRMAFGALFLFAAALPAGGQGDDAKKKQAELMAAYVRAGTPGPQHKLLEPIIGKWNFAGKFWHMDSSQPAMEAKGTAERKWVLGGRFVLDEAQSGSFEGEAFKGLGMMGYDNVQEKFVSIWTDSMTTAITQSVGTADAAGKVFTYHKEEVDPLTKQKFKARDVVKIEGKDRHVMEMYKTPPGGKEFKTGEIVFTRK